MSRALPSGACVRKQIIAGHDSRREGEDDREHRISLWWSSTWVDEVRFWAQFPHVSLEDKAVLNEEGIDTHQVGPGPIVNLLSFYYKRLWTLLLRA